MAGIFLGALVAEHIPRGDRWRLCAPLVYRTQCGETICVPVGAETDFMSVPATLVPFFPRHGRYAESAVIHDYLYHQGRESRYTADRWLVEAMGAQGAGALTRTLTLIGIRLFGWYRWRKLRK